MQQPQLSRAYQLTRQRIAQLVLQYGIEAVGDPNKLYKILAGRSASRLKHALSDPARRKLIQQRLSAQVEIPELRGQIADLRVERRKHLDVIANNFQAIAGIRAGISIKYRRIKKIIAELNS
jgi:hypothetical protein